MRTLEQLIKGIRSEFVFRPRPTALPPELRPDWRIAVILLILLKTGRAGTASLKKLHVISWAIRDAETRTTFLAVLNDAKSPESLMVRFDPALNRALEFAIGEKLVRFERLVSGGLNASLTEKGRHAAEQIETLQDCLTEEREFLAEVGKISESKIESLLTWED